MSNTYIIGVVEAFTRCWNGI